MTLHSSGGLFLGFDLTLLPAYLLIQPYSQE